PLCTALLTLCFCMIGCDSKSGAELRPQALAQGQMNKPSAEGKSPTGQPTTPATHVESGPVTPVEQDLTQLKFDHGVRVFLEGKDPRVEAKGMLLSGQSRPLEYLIIGPGGPAHESLIEID